MGSGKQAARNGPAEGSFRRSLLTKETLILVFTKMIYAEDAFKSRFPPSGRSIHLPTHPATSCPPTHLSTHSFIYLPIYSSIYLSTRPPAHTFTHLPTHLVTQLPIHSAVHHSYIRPHEPLSPSSYSSTHLSVCSPSHVLIHPFVSLFIPQTLGDLQLARPCTWMAPR